MIPRNKSNKENLRILLILKKTIVGNKNIVIQKRFNRYVPVNDKICKILSKLDKLKTIKFHGKPVKIVPLTNSTKENINPTVSSDEKFLLRLKKDKIKNFKP